MKKTIGIIGGMGPAATVDLFHQIVQHTSAGCDQEHIHIFIDCNPAIPDRTAAIIEGGPSPLEDLCAGAKRLFRAGADFLIIPCNTAHYFINEVRDSVPVPILDMIEETARTVSQEGYSRAIILCTEGTRETGIYTSRFEDQGLEVIYPDQTLQNEVNRIIYEGIKSGAKDFDVTLFNHLLKAMEERTGAIAVLGCTELPVAMERYKLRGHFINPTSVLARAAIEKAGYNVRSGTGES